VFFRENVIFLCYVNDSIFAGPDLNGINKAIKDLSDIRKARNRYILEDQGDIKDYLGINFEYLPVGKIKLSQPHLIRGETRSLPSLSSKLLKRDENDPP